MTKDEKNIKAIAEAGEIEKETLRSVMSMLAKRRWAKISKKKRSEQMRRVSLARFK